MALIALSCAMNSRGEGKSLVHSKSNRVGFALPAQLVCRHFMLRYVHGFPPAYEFPCPKTNDPSRFSLKDTYIVCQ